MLCVDKRVYYCHYDTRLCSFQKSGEPGIGTGTETALAGKATERYTVTTSVVIAGVEVGRAEVEVVGVCLTIRRMWPIAVAWGLIAQTTSIVIVAAGADKAESVKLYNSVVIIGSTISFSPHIILNQSDIGTSTSRGWERHTGSTDRVFAIFWRDFGAILARFRNFMI